MARNLLVAYDLNNPGQNYQNVIAEIQRHGVWLKLEYSLFYLQTNETAEQVRDAVWRVMDSNDKLVVVEAVMGAWAGLDKQTGDRMLQLWQYRHAA